MARPPLHEDAVHGYSLRDIDRIAHAAIARSRAYAMDYRDRYDAAWHAIAEQLCASDTRPEPGDLKHAGAVAVDKIIEDHGHHRGFDRRNPDGGYEAMRGYQKFWVLAVRPVASPEEAVTDKVAFRQIWQALPPAHRQTLIAMAVYGNHAVAADASGVSYSSFTSRLRHARRAFLRLWHEGEKPSGIWGRSDHRHGRRTAAQVLARRIWQRARRAGQQEMA